VEPGARAIVCVENVVATNGNTTRKTQSKVCLAEECVVIVVTRDLATWGFPKLSRIGGVPVVERDSKEE
jgi:hypothetical protein